MLLPLRPQPRGQPRHRLRPLRRSRLRPRALPAVVPWLLGCALLLPTPLSAQRTRTLHGRVVALDRSSVEGLRLRIVGYGDPVVYRSGEFTQEIPADVDAVVIESRDTAWAVVYPPAGRVAVPAGDEPVVVMVGEPIERTVTRALAERRRQSEALLTQYGVQSERLAGVETGIERILRKLDLREADLRDEVARKDRQVVEYPPIAAAVTQLLARGHDFHDALALLEPIIANNPQQAFDGLMVVINAYNASFDTLRANRAMYETNVEHDWSDGALARRDFADLLDNVILPLHRQHIQGMNDVLGRVQDALFGGRRDDRYRESMAELGRRLPELQRALETADMRATQVLERLRPR